MSTNTRLQVLDTPVYSYSLYSTWFFKVLDSPITKTFCHRRPVFCYFFLWPWHCLTLFHSLSLTHSLSLPHSLILSLYYFIIFYKFVFISSKVFTPILSLFTLTGLRITIRTSGAGDGQLYIFMIVLIPNIPEIQIHCTLICTFWNNSFRSNLTYCK